MLLTLNFELETEQKYLRIRQWFHSFFQFEKAQDEHLVIPDTAPSPHVRVGQQFAWVLCPNFHPHLKIGAEWRQPWEVSHTSIREQARLSVGDVGGKRRSKMKLNSSIWTGMKRRQSQKKKIRSRKKLFERKLFRSECGDLPRWIIQWTNHWKSSQCLYQLSWRIWVSRWRWNC